MVSKNRRIAKNTTMLYFRMLLTMLVTLYTSRIVLNTLGVSDFGIYNVVGGFVTMFSFLNNSMSSATQRFMSFEIGKNNYTQLKKVFSMSINIHFIIAFVIFILAETIGLWFVTTQLTIPESRILAAKWVYQFSIFSLLIGVLSVPYNALIIAHERMNVYAWVSIVDVILKLLIVFLLQLFGFDKLKLYALLIFLITIVIRLIYGFYCNRKFSESKYVFFWEKELFNTLISYASWNLWGNLAVVFYGQGINILLNIFFGPVVNAARGIAYQLKSAIHGFFQNFQIAMNPQIVKSFAIGDLKNMHSLVMNGAKYSFFLILLLSMPLLIETKTVLHLWLKVVPDYTIIFTRLVLINVLIDCLSGSLSTAAQASGKIKIYQSVVGGLLILILPISWLFLKNGYPPYIALYVSITISMIALFARLIILKSLIKLELSKYYNNVILPVIFVVLFSAPIPILSHFLIESGIAKFILVILISFTCTTFAILFVGIGNTERIFLKSVVKKSVKSIFRK